MSFGSSCDTDMTTPFSPKIQNTKSDKRLFIVPIFIPHAGCPHSCVFCNQCIITEKADSLPSIKRIKIEIDRFLNYRQPLHAQPQISFYGGTFLGLDDQTIQDLLHVAESYVTREQAASIRFSTRPDSITTPKLDLIRNFSIRTIELGVQSMDDDVLQRSRRGHTSDDTRNAIDLLKQTGYAIGAQLMIGLPGQNEASAMDTARQIANLNPDFVRIYPTLVLKDSLLESWFRKGIYEPMSLPVAVNQAKGIYTIFQKKDIPVIRMGLQTSEGLHKDNDVVVGPYHPAFGHLVHSELFFDKASVKLSLKVPPIKTVTIRVHPKSIPKMRGLKNSTIKRLKSSFRIGSLRLEGDTTLAKNDVVVRA